MGLDMYLDKETYSGSRWDTVNGKCELTVTRNEGDVEKLTGIKVSRINSIRESMGYWRKANAIHAWFVEKSEMEDNCQEFEVSYDDIKELHDLCVEVRDDPSKAEELLPTQCGFFFGDTGYGEAYFQDLHDTIQICKDCMNEPKNSYFIYRASWQHHELR